MYYAKGKVKEHKTNKTKTIYLGKKCEFKKDDNIIVLAETDFNNIKNITELNTTLDDLTAKNDELNNTIKDVKQLLLDKDDRINELEKELAKYENINIDDLNNKSNVIHLLDNQIIELQQLLNYNLALGEAYKNQNLLNRLLNKTPVIDRPKPTLKLIDNAGNILKENDKVIDSKK